MHEAQVLDQPFRAEAVQFVVVVLIRIDRGDDFYALTVPCDSEIEAS